QAALARRDVPATRRSTGRTRKTGVVLALECWCPDLSRFQLPRRNVYSVPPRDIKASERDLAVSRKKKKRSKDSHVVLHSLLSDHAIGRMDQRLPDNATENDRRMIRGNQERPR